MATTRLCCNELRALAGVSLKAKSIFEHSARTHADAGASIRSGETPVLLCPHPCGCRVTVSATPGHSGTLKKVRADFNRCAGQVA